MVGSVDGKFFKPVDDECPSLFAQKSEIIFVPNYFISSLLRLGTVPRSDHTSLEVL